MNFMLEHNLCSVTCGRSSAGGSSFENVPDQGSCQEHKEWGNCNMDFMVEYDLCSVTCGR